MPMYEYECPRGHRTTMPRPVAMRHVPHVCTYPVGEGRAVSEGTEFKSGDGKPVATEYDQCGQEATLVPSVFVGQVSGGTPKFYPGRN